MPRGKAELGGKGDACGMSVSPGGARQHVSNTRRQETHCQVLLTVPRVPSLASRAAGTKGPWVGCLGTFRRALGESPRDASVGLPERCPSHPRLPHLLLLPLPLPQFRSSPAAQYQAVPAGRLGSRAPAVSAAGWGKCDHVWWWHCLRGFYGVSGAKPC